MIINVYKEKNWTSFDVVAKIRGILRKNRNTKKVKVGHAGTLDPLAEGVLLILTDEDTKKQSELMGQEKEYEAVVGFGVTSPTYDMEGNLNIQGLPEGFDLENLLPEAISKYVGDIEQTVPPYSAVKVDGKALYKSAREGKVDQIELPTRKVSIYEIEILKYEVYSNEMGIKIPTATLRIRCGKGTYIRSLVHDLGEDLGVGAVLMKLVRTKVGNYTSEEAKKISELEI